MLDGIGRLRAGGSFSPASVFAGDAAGLWLDPINLETLYQAALAGAVITTSGQTVGGAADNRFGIGPELLVNGNFATDSNWAKGTGWAITGGEAVKTPGVQSAVSQSPFTFSFGTYYRARWTSVASAGLSFVSIGSGSDSGGIGTAADYNFFGRPLGSTSFSIQGVNTFDGSVDNASLRHWPGNHLYQSSASARPEYSEIGGIHSLYCDGTDDGLTTETFAAGTLTADMDCFIAVNRASLTASTLIRNDGAVYFVNYAAGPNAALAAEGCGASVSYYVDGVAVPGGTSVNAGDLGNALPVGEWAILEVRNLDLSAWTVFGISTYVGAQFDGDIGGLILCPAQSDETRAQLRKWLGAKVGLSL